MRLEYEVSYQATYPAFKAQKDDMYLPAGVKISQIETIIHSVSNA